MSTDSAPEPEEHPASDQADSFVWGRPRLTLAIIAVAFVGSIFVFITLAAHMSDTTAKKEPEDVIKDDEDSKAKDGKTEEPKEKEPPIDPSLLAVRKSKLGRLQSRLRRVKSNWDELDRSSKKWHGEIQQRLSGDDGRKLAADRHLVERYIAISEQDREPVEGIDSLGKNLEDFARGLKATEAVIEKRQLEINEDAVRNELDVRDSEVLAALKRYEEDVLMVEVLLGQANVLKPGRLSLIEVIREIDDEKKERSSERMAEAAKRGEEAGLRELEVLKEKRERLKKAKELIQAQKQTEMDEADFRDLQAQAKHDAEMREAAEKLAALERRFEQAYPAMEKYLTPFTSNGYNQPTGRTYHRTTTKGPVSYKSLVGAGVLGESSVETFYYSTVAGNNDRELGAFPPHSFSSGHFERHYETILKVQAFLREFGPVMAQEKRKILAP